MMITSEKQKKYRKQSSVASAAEAFYILFNTLPKKEKITVARYILEDDEITFHINASEIPNETTLRSFAEEKHKMPSFHSIDELRKDLLS